MVESLKVVLRTGSIFVGALIVGSIVQHYNMSQDAAEEVWMPPTDISVESTCPRFVCDEATEPE